MRKYLFILLATLMMLSHADERHDTKFVVNLMATAKATGMCDVISQMLSFQEKSKMPGADEFIIRFLESEAARYDSTLESLMIMCPNTVQKYNDTLLLFSGKQ